MSKGELKRFHVIKNAVDEEITVNQAAERLGLSPRRIKQLKKEFRENGVVAVIHGNSNKPSPKRFPDDLEKQIISLRNDPVLKQSNFTHFHEILIEKYHISISYSTLYRLLTKEGFKSPKKRRKKKDIHPIRERRPAEGMLLQADASQHQWFLGDKSSYALHGFIDDATGKITGLYFTKNECLLGYLEVLRQTLTNFGIPQSLYPDRYSVFFVNPKLAQNLTIEEQLDGVTERKTQFGRIVHELGINMFPAFTPQAKGRIERVWDTLQSRLPVVFGLSEITTLEEANTFLKDYIPVFNEQFAVPATESFSAFIPIPHTVDLDRLLSVVIPRKLSAGSTVSVKNVTYKIKQKNFTSRTHVDLLLSEKFGLRALINGDFYPITALEPLTNSENDIYISHVVQQLLELYLFKDAKH